MKNIISFYLFLAGFLFISVSVNCQNELYNKNRKTIIFDSEKLRNTDNNKSFPILYYKEFLQIEKNDTIEKNNYTITFQPSEKTSFPDYYPDQKERIKAGKNLGNFLERAMEIEKYLYPKHSDIFSYNDSILTINLKRNKKVIFLKNRNPYDENSITYCFDSYFPDMDYILVFIMYYEGGEYLLINRKNGEMAFLEGRPYFSPDKKQFFTINKDIYAAYTMNGIEYFLIKSGKFYKKFEIPVSNWGPVDLKWISNNSALIKLDRIFNLNMDTYIDYSLMILENKVKYK